MNFLALLFAHLLADYPLQGDFLANMKGKNFIVLVSHAGIWTGTILTAAHFLGYSVNFVDVITLFIVHAIADYAKAKPLWYYKDLPPLTAGLACDQLIHVAQIFIFCTYKGFY